MEKYELAPRPMYRHYAISSMRLGSFTSVGVPTSTEKLRADIEWRVDVDELEAARVLDFLASARSLTQLARMATKRTCGSIRASGGPRPSSMLP